MSVPSGTHAGGVQEESEVEVKTSHFHHTQERRGLIPNLAGEPGREDKAPVISMNDALVPDQVATIAFYILHHQWLYYE